MRPQANAVDNTASAKGFWPDAPALRQVARWLLLGWADFKANPGIALAYGLGIMAASWGIVIWLWTASLAWMILPAAAGALLVMPLIAAGLYHVARNSTEAKRPFNWTQLSLAGGILMVLQLAWLRAATILFALIYGLQPFPGFVESLGILLTTGSGWALLITGSAIGGLFAAFGFSITAFSIPMLIDRDIDAFSAMGISFSTVTHNMPVSLCWATALCILTGLGILTGGVLLVVIFPVLGFAAWHAYQDILGS